MLTLENIPISSIRRLDFKEKYYVRIKASLETNEFWFPFNHLFFFLPLNSFNASWAESSPLSIDPDMANSMNNFSNGSQDKVKNEPKGVNNVVRSFHQ
jgi:hypothetical protein